MNSSSKAEAVYQFDTLMKCLDGPQQQVQPVMFSCNSPQDDENSNETDLIRSKKATDQNNKASQLPSIDSLITQSMNNISKSNETIATRTNTHQNSTATNQGQYPTHSDMDWNDTEFLKLCEELDNANNLFGKLDQKTSIHKMHHTPNDLLINGHTNSYHMFEDHNTINSSSHHGINRTVNGTNANHLQQHQPDSSHLMFNNSTNGLDFHATTNNHHHMHHQQQDFYANNASINQFSNIQNQSQVINGGSLVQANSTIANNNNNNANSNIMMPWEFDNDINQIATYLQSPTV